MNSLTVIMSTMMSASNRFSLVASLHFKPSSFLYNNITKYLLSIMSMGQFFYHILLYMAAITISKIKQKASGDVT